MKLFFVFIYILIRAAFIKRAANLFFRGEQRENNILVLMPIFFGAAFFSSFGLLGILSVVFMIWLFFGSFGVLVSENSDRFQKINALFDLFDELFIWLPSYYALLSSWNSSQQVYFINICIF